MLHDLKEMCLVTWKEQNQCYAMMPSACLYVCFSTCELQEESRIGKLNLEQSALILNCEYVRVKQIFRLTLEWANWK